VIHPATGTEIDVVALYGEAPASVIATLTSLATAAGMTIAMTAPDSVLAVAARSQVDLAALRTALASLAATARIAVGKSRASIQGSMVDGPALDAESWAPYPLGDGLWIAEDL
jgi:hypothetical protein